MRRREPRATLSPEAILKLAGLTLALAALLVSSAARAQDDGDPSGQPRVRLLSLRGLSFSADQEVGALVRPGDVPLPMGIALNSSFVVGGQAWSITSNRTDVRYFGDRPGETDPIVALEAAGLLLAYRSTPEAIFVSATPSLTLHTPDRDPRFRLSEVGMAVKLAVGKEWWAGERLALGLNAQAAFASEQSRAGPWQTGWIGLAFGARFN